MKKKVFECDRCAACCIHLMVPIYPEDERRDIRISLNTIPSDDGLKVLYQDDGHSVFKGCPLLTEFGSCGIYANRPHVCRVFKPGTEQCQNTRGLAGLPTLMPVAVI